jgi:hypothetical protein
MGAVCELSVLLILSFPLYQMMINWQKVKVVEQVMEIEADNVSKQEEETGL